MYRLDNITVERNPECDNNFVEELEELAVRDETGEKILYDSAISDVKALENEIIKIGSYFIDKYERLVREERAEDQGISFAI